MVSLSHLIRAPISPSTCSIAFISFGFAPVRHISPPVIAEAARYVAATILSGIIVYSAPCRESVPRIVITLDPIPLISAPIAFRKLPRSVISGSLAAFVIDVRPSAVAAASIMFSVAPTLGKSR